MKPALLLATAVAFVSNASANMLVKEIVIASHNNANATYIADPQLRPDSVIGQPSTCRDGFAEVGDEDFECDNVDFYSFIAYKDLEITVRKHFFEADAADIWGWLSPGGKEVTIIALDNGVVLVDSTDPVNPCILAKLPSSIPSDIWADVKVYDNTLYHVKDQRGSHPVVNENFAIEVYDLLPFDSIICSAPNYVAPNIFPDYIVPNHGWTHNIAVNTERGRIYTVGTDTCKGGINVYDVKTDRLKPTFLACVDGDGYTHDVQCVNYDGPDTRFTGEDICFAFNEDTLTIWNLTDPTFPLMISTTLYFNQAYSHQGWLMRGMEKILLDDELDELCNDGQYASTCESLVQSGLSGETRTSTTVFSITDLTAPFVESRYIHKDRSIDHNLYVWGAIHEKGWGGNAPMEFFPDPNYAYLNNYMAGLRIIDMHDSNSSNWKEAGFFDITPNETFLEFFGAWSGYMHPSGVYAISSIERGLFLVQPRTSFTEEFPKGEEPEEKSRTAGIVIAGVFSAAFVFTVSAAFYFLKTGKPIPGFSSGIGSEKATGSPASAVQDDSQLVKHYVEQPTVDI